MLPDDSAYIARDVWRYTAANNDTLAFVMDG